AASLRPPTESTATATMPTNRDRQKITRMPLAPLVTLIGIGARIVRVTHGFANRGERANPAMSGAKGAHMSHSLPLPKWRINLVPRHPLKGAMHGRVTAEFRHCAQCDVAIRRAGIPVDLAKLERGINQDLPDVPRDQLRTAATAPTFIIIEDSNM